MTKRSRRIHSGASKDKVALAAIKGEVTLAQLATRFDVHLNQIVQLRGQLLERDLDVSASTGQPAESGPQIKTLHSVVGQLSLENDFVNRHTRRGRDEWRSWRDVGLLKLTPVLHIGDENYNAHQETLPSEVLRT